MLSNGGCQGTRGTRNLHDAPTSEPFTGGSLVHRDNTCHIGPKVPHRKPNTPTGAQVLFNFGAELFFKVTHSQREGLTIARVEDPYFSRVDAQSLTHQKEAQAASGKTVVRTRSVYGCELRVHKLGICHVRFDTFSHSCTILG